MDIQKKLKAYADVELEESLKLHTTFRIGGVAKYCIYPKNELGLTRVIQVLDEEGIQYRVLGKGSNILASDNYYDGAIICLDRYFTNFYFEPDGTCIAQAGMSIILLSIEALGRGLSGLEWASGIPGTVGGAAFMNAGAYNSDFTSVLQEVLILRDGKLEWVAIEELNFTYRTTIFQKHRDWIILACRMKLEKGKESEIRELIDNRRQRRKRSQPLDLPSAGSMFRNPSGHQSWELVESIGYRGKNVGDAAVSDKHTNFLVNRGSAQASDMMALIKEIQKKVKEEYDVDLVMEVEKFNWDE